MTWPTVPIVTTAMDAGTDTPPRDQIKAMADAINDMIATPPAAGVGRLLGVQKFLTAGSFSYTPTAGTTRVVLEVRGGGGSGAGTIAAAAGQATHGGPGGAGGYGLFLMDVDFASAAVVVGAGGAGAGAGANGTDGGTTTVAMGPTGRIALAEGGRAGTCSVALVTFPYASYTFGSGGSGGAILTPLPGDFVIKSQAGGSGHASLALNASFQCVGHGGVPFGFGPKGGFEYTGASSPGWSITEPGSGAGGRGYGNSAGGAARSNGGTGASGSVVVWEYA